MKACYFFTIILTCVEVFALRAVADSSPPAPSDLVQQVQAANLLADLITYTVDRGDARINDARAFLQSIGKETGYEQNKPIAPVPRPLNYMLLFRGSLAFVEGDGKKYADDSVKNESASQLYQDLTAAQYYNMHEFLHFNEQKQTFASIRAYLQSIGEFDKYESATQGEPIAANLPTTQPTATTPQQVALRMGEMLNFIHETAWKEALAKGTSQTEFEAHWPEQVKQYRDSVMAKIEGSQPGEGGFGKSQLAGSTPPPPSIPAPPLQPPTVQYIGPQEDLGTVRPLPPPVPSPYSNARYREKDRRLWDMWDYDPRY